MGIISKAAASAHRARPFYEEHEISDELKSVLEEEAKHLVGARRRSTEDAFEEGERSIGSPRFCPKGPWRNGRSNVAATPRGTCAPSVRSTATWLLTKRAHRTRCRSDCPRKAECCHAGADRAGHRLCQHAMIGCAFRMSRRSSPGRSRTLRRSPKSIRTISVGLTGLRRSSPSRYGTA